VGSAVETEAQTLNARKDNNYDYMYPFLEPKGIFHELYPLLVSTTLTHYVLRLSLITFWLPSGLTLALLSLLFYWLRLLFRWFTFVCGLHDLLCLTAPISDRTSPSHGSRKDALAPKCTPGTPNRQPGTPKCMPRAPNCALGDQK